MLRSRRLASGRNAVTAARTPQLAVVLPVHNEERLLPGALEALERASDGVDVVPDVIVVLDSCTDASRDIAETWAAAAAGRRRVRPRLVTCDARNVGEARRVGCHAALENSSSRCGLWIATSDADSRVPPNWLRAQLWCRARGFDAWAGRVTLREEFGIERRHLSEWSRRYERERRPIHGANLGFDAAWYESVGGFAARESGEDRELVRALVKAGASVYFDATTRVLTSARRDARAPDGFARALDRVEESLSSLNG